MGRGRAPCCDKSQVKRGPWSPAEDLRLITFIQKNGHDNWRALPKQAGLARCGKSCRLRWINYLRPDLRRGNFTPEEEDAIIKLHNVLGNKWSKIASHLPGRTDNEIKNVWNTHLKKRLAKKVIRDQSSGDEPKESSISSSASSSIESCKDYKCAIVNQELLNMVVPKISNHQSSPSKEETVKVMQSSSSSTSRSSLVSITDELDVTTREELMDSSFDYSQSNNYNQAPNTEDASQDTILYKGFELPLEFDFDIWELLDDNLGSFQSSKLAEQVPVGEVIQSSGNKNLVQDEEVDCINWLKYIEYELELDGGSADNDGKRLDALTKNETGNDLAASTLKQDVDQSSSAGLSFFQSWPSSPQTTFFI